MPDDLHTLIRRARARLCLAAIARMLSWRVALVLCVALVLALLSRWTPIVPWPLVYVVAATCFISLILQLRQLPSHPAAAMELDRQYAAAELLSSAIVMAPGPRNDIENAVLSGAHARITEIELSRFNAGRTGLRWWVTSLILSGLIPILYVAPKAHPRAHTSPAASSQFQSAPRLTRYPETPLTTEPSRSSGRSLPAPVSSRDVPDSASGTAHPSAGNGDSTDSNTSGTGLATGSASPNSDTPQKQIGSPTTQSPSSTGATVGHSTPQTLGDSDAVGVVAADPTAPSADTGNARPLPAHDEIDSEPLPPRYRAVVRGYFSR